MPVKTRRFCSFDIGPKTYFCITRQFASIRGVHNDLQRDAARFTERAARSEPLFLRQFLSGFPRILNDAHVPSDHDECGVTLCCHGI
jgi:hypothetical protein